MATGTIPFVGEFIRKGVHQVTWTATASGAGFAYDGHYFNDKTVQVFMPTGAGNTSHIIVEGSNDPTPSGTFITLQDDQNNNLDFTNNTALEVIMQNPRFIRPRFETATVADGTIKVVIVSRGDLR